MSAAKADSPDEDAALAHRIRAVNDAPVRRDRDFVLYWMVAARRLEWNHALQRAVSWARTLDRPLLILEALRCDYRWASRRLHRFCLDGMAQHQARLRDARVGYLPYVEAKAGEGRGLLEALGRRATTIVTDDFPSFFLPRMVEAAGARLDVRLEAVDSNGLLPLERAGRDFTTARSFRGFMHRALPELLEAPPAEHPLTGDPLPPMGALPDEVTRRWPAADLPGPTSAGGFDLSPLPLDGEVDVVRSTGGRSGAISRLERFLDAGLPGYAEGRNHPDRDHPSRLSPYLHWGHVGAWEVVQRVLDREGWTPARIREDEVGRREGWWGLGADAEAFLEQLTIWRELGYVTAWENPEHEEYDSLPGWARATLEEHSRDPRPHLYEPHEFEAAETHDPIWNAAQRELRQEGVIHNYLRMLWGKKILEWSPSPQEALELMLHLNNRWALDGRNPNSTSGIFWILGRYDRGWPSRPVFGTVRSMSSERTRKKVEMERYLEHHDG
jgi:deoxyribodipyrimidine photo-lyase